MDKKAEQEQIKGDCIEVDGLRVGEKMVRDWRGRIHELDWERQALDQRIQELEAALKLAKDMFIANDVSLPHTFEVIDDALESAAPSVEAGGLDKEKLVSALHRVAGTKHSFLALEENDRNIANNMLEFIDRGDFDI